MDDLNVILLRSILDDVETGRISDRDLTKCLDALPPEKLGWLAGESIRRYEAFERRGSTKPERDRAKFLIRGTFAG